MSADFQVMPSIHSKQDAPPNFASSLTPRSRAFLKVISVLGSRTSGAMVKPRTVVSDGGWTTIKSGSVGRKAGRAQRRDETQLRMSDVDRDVNADQLEKEYATVKKELESSKFYTETITYAKLNVFGSISGATAVIALGLGSVVSMNGWKTTLFQIAYLESLLSTSGLTSLPKYVQDPVLKDADITFFRKLGYTVLDDPRGFEMIHSSTFVYAPHLENTHTEIALRKEPLAMLCNDVSMWTSIMPDSELAKFPTLNSVDFKYSGYEFPNSDEIFGGRVFNNLKFYYPLHESTECAGIQLKITPAEPDRPSQEKEKEVTLQKGERTFLTPDAWVPRPSFTLKTPTPKAFKLRALKKEETSGGEGEVGSLFARRRGPERVDKPSFVPPPVVRSNGQRLYLRQWEPSTAFAPAVEPAPASPDRFKEACIEEKDMQSSDSEEEDTKRISFPNFVLSNLPTPMPGVCTPDTPRTLPPVPLLLPPPPSPGASSLSFFPSSNLDEPRHSIDRSALSNEAIDGLRQSLNPAPRPTLTALKTDFDQPLPSPRLGRLSMRTNNTFGIRSPEKDASDSNAGTSLLQRRAAKRSSSVPLMLTTKRNTFEIEPPPSPMTATFGTKDILDDSLPPPPPSPRPAAKSLRLVLPPKSPPRNTSVPIPGPLVDPLFPGNHSASRAADNLRNFSRGSKGWRSGLTSRRQSA